METKPIPDYPEYSVTADGQVFGIYGNRLSPFNNRGYLQVRIRQPEGGHKNRLIHRMVWEAWKGPIPKGYWINHENGIKSDNRLENLKCDTPSYNICHSRDVLKRQWAKGESNGKNILDELCIKAIFELHKAGWSTRNIAAVFLVSQPCIVNILNKKTWKHVEV